MTALLAVLVLPGLLVGLAARLPLRLALAASMPVSYGVAGLAGYLLDRIDVPWGVGSYALSTLVVIAVVALLTSLVLWVRGPRRRPRAPSPREWPGRVRAHLRAQWPPRPRHVWMWLPGIASLIAAWLVGQMVITELSGTPGGIGDVFQGWDAHWHADYVRFIHDTGLASPDRAGELRYPETGKTLYYPSTWHAIAALVMSITGIGAVETYNLVQIGTLSLAFPLGVAALAWLLTRRGFSRPVAATASAVAALATPLFPGLPFVEMMVAATPSAAANGLAGLEAALVVGALANRRLIPVAALGLVGLGGVHPSAVFTAGAIVLLWWLFGGLWRPVRGRLVDLATLAGIGVAGVLALLPQVLSISAEADDISAFAFQIDANRAETWGKALTLQVRHVQDWGIRWWLLGCAAVGLLALLRRFVLWPVVLWAGLVVLCVNAMKVFGTPMGGILRSIGSVYYNDPRRVGVAMAMLVAAVVGVGVAAVAQGLAGLLGRLMDPITDPRGDAIDGARVGVAVAACVAMGSWTIQAAPEYAVAAGTSQRWGRLVDVHDLAAYRWLATQPEAYSGLIATNPDEGSGWMYATEGLPSAWRHYLFDASGAPDSTLLLGALDRAGIDPDVDAALARLNTHYVVISPPNYWGFQKPNKHLLELDATPGLQKVYADAQVRIFAVRAAFTPEQLQAIHDSSPFPPDHRAPVTRASALYGAEAPGS